MTPTDNRKSFFAGIGFFLLLLLLNTTQIKSIELSEAEINLGLIKKDPINMDLLNACSKALVVIKELKTLRQEAAQYERQRILEGFKLLETKGVVKRKLKEIYKRIHELKGTLAEQQNQVEVLYQVETRAIILKKTSLSRLNVVINFILDPAEYLRQQGSL